MLAADTYFGPGTVENIKCHLKALESEEQVFLMSSINPGNLTMLLLIFAFPIALESKSGPNLVWLLLIRRNTQASQILSGGWEEIFFFFFYPLFFLILLWLVGSHFGSYHRCGRLRYRWVRSVIIVFGIVLAIKSFEWVFIGKIVECQWWICSLLKHIAAWSLVTCFRKVQWQIKSMVIDFRCSI